MTDRGSKTGQGEGQEEATRHQTRVQAVNLQNRDTLSRQETLEFPPSDIENIEISGKLQKRSEKMGERSHIYSSRLAQLK